MRTNQDGKDVKLVIGWLCGRNLTDAEMALALDMPTSNYGRRKDAEDFPTFEELSALADHFKLSKMALQVAFGYLDPNMVLLDNEGLRQYVEQGGGQAPFFPSRSRRKVSTGTRIEPQVKQPKSHRRRRPDAPPGA